ncbi:hypothetical protein BUALT_Bualt07G0112500 [Buddleja alternifolia]|uniref:Uncharacterized protein n=1 Tax=Buddleja alternifolia TaxID=168488 RepID=A0AAV6XB68_9LAMI|nr:hypothetical protein BUALT_Bualt07G0112500 [Buddleja alternifolia]
MADAAVEFLLGNLQQLLSYHANLIIGAQDEVKQMECDIIDSFVTQAADIKTKNYFIRAFRTPVSLHDIATQVKSVGEQINRICGGSGRLDLATLDMSGDETTEKQEVPVLRQVNVVGFEDEAEKISGYLIEKTQHLDVISIIGMPGLGKTTLAGKIYHDPSIQYEFPIRIWVYISQEFEPKDVFIEILKELITSLPEDMYRKTDRELAKIVCEYLERGKFLIVMDDVWAAADWDKLKIALPITNNMGKVLITSRQREVGLYANRIRPPHQLRFFTQEESWLLLQLEVFGKPECPSELETLGKLIAQQCGGLPLAIVVIGGILAKKYSASEDLSAMRNTWTKVSDRVNEYLLEEDPTRSMERIIALSYDKLPNHLRACFLYLGMFPEDSEISVWKLVRMWVAEGFIQQKQGISLEETAENYLQDLIDRNLIKIDKMRSNGKVKTCRIHDMLRDFCKNEGGKERENFLQEVKMSSEGIFESLDFQVVNSRRLCIHSNVLSFVSARPFGPHVRSFVCFSKEDIALPTEHMSAILTAFKLLRVLDVKPIKFTRIPSEMYQLLHLRYIHLSLTLASLPKAFTKLLNVETLIVDTTSRTLEIKAEIWKMAHLRYLQTNASTILPKPTSSSKEGGKFQTLSTISPTSCTKEVFDRACNLKKLGIRGKLATLLDGKKEGSFDSLQGLEGLEKLKLLNDVFLDPTAGNKLGRLPPADLFPPKLKSLTISDTYLDWSQMAVLGLLKYLEVLKLKDNAFVGKSWETEYGGFRHLEVLYIGHTNLAIWKTLADHFPRLRRLELRNCEQLQEIPIELADISTLQLLDLFRASSAASSAKKIQAKRTGIKLSIFPTNE